MKLIIKSEEFKVEYEIFKEPLFDSQLIDQLECFERFIRKIKKEEKK